MTMQTRSNPFVSTATLISAMCAAQASGKRASPSWRLSDGHRRDRR